MASNTLDGEKLRIGSVAIHCEDDTRKARLEKTLEKSCTSCHTLHCEDDGRKATREKNTVYLYTLGWFKAHEELGMGLLGWNIRV